MTRILIEKNKYNALVKFLSGDITIKSTNSKLPTFNFTDSTITVEELIEITKWISRSADLFDSQGISVCISKLLVDKADLIKEEIKDKPQAIDLFYKILYQHKDGLVHLEAYKHYTQNNHIDGSPQDHIEVATPPIFNIINAMGASLMVSCACLLLPSYWKIASVLSIGCGIWASVYMVNQHKEYESIVNEIQEDYLYKLDHLFDDSYSLETCLHDSTIEQINLLQAF